MNIRVQVFQDTKQDPRTSTEARLVYEGDAPLGACVEQVLEVLRSNSKRVIVLEANCLVVTASMEWYEPRDGLNLHEVDTAYVGEGCVYVFTQKPKAPHHDFNHLITVAHALSYTYPEFATDAVREQIHQSQVGMGAGSRTLVHRR